MCLSVPRCIPTLLHGPGCKLGEWYGRPLVVHYRADLQSVHGLRYYDNSAEREMSASACTRSVPGLDAPIVSSVTAQSSQTSVPIITLLHLYA